MVGFDVLVGVPAAAGAAIQLHETDAALDQAAGEQAVLRRKPRVSSSSMPYSFLVASDSLERSTASGAALCILYASS